MKVTIQFDVELQQPRVTLVPESSAEEQDLELLAGFDSVRFSYEIKEGPQEKEP